MQILSRGVLYSLGIVFNRIIPERIMRFRIFRVYELAAHQCEDAELDQGSSFHTIWCRGAPQYEVAQALTQYSPHEDEDSPRGHEHHSGHSACMVLDGEQPIGAAWLATESFGELELGLQYALADDQAWLFSAQIAKPHRGRGAYRCLLREVLSERPEKRKFVAINPTNRRSMTAHRSSFVRILGTCVALRVFSLATCFTTGDLKPDRRFRWNCHDDPISVSWCRSRPR